MEHNTKFEENTMGAGAIGRQDVSGRYRCADGGFEVELRVDIDGRRATNRVSADYYRTDALPATYLGSMRIDRPVTSRTPAQTTITGDATFTWPTRHTRVTVTIPRTAAGAGTPQATLRHFTKAGAVGAEYVCSFESENFRAVQLVESRERSVVKFTTYDTGLLPSGAPARELSAVAAFAEAGIEVVQAQEPAEVDTSLAGRDAAWSDAELHAAMQLSFSRWFDHPQWALWLFHAVVHEDPGVFGLMFDSKGPQRQGCAVFYHGITPSTPEFQRELLRVSVHEIGHVFNLPHCWQRTCGEPPLPSRPGARSWMNYPERFPGGSEAYWSTFGFQFDDEELVHLRHAYRNNVIMGGSPFVGWAASEPSASWDAAPRAPGIRLGLSAPPSLPLGVPVTVRLELSSTTHVPQLVPRVLGPRPATVDLAIRDPRGNAFVFEPLLHHCRGQELVALSAGDPPVRDYAFVHYGRDGFTFDAPGTYRVRARHVTFDGSVALSGERLIRVHPPATRAEREVAALTAGDDEIGTLMSLMGSHSHALRGGNDTLRTITERYPGHPVADIARVIHGANLARAFKLLEPDGNVSLRRPDTSSAAALVAGVVDVAALKRGTAQPAARTRDIPTRPGIAPSVHAFVNSRRSEINAAIRGAIPAPGSTTSTGSARGHDFALGPRTRRWP